MLLLLLLVAASLLAEAAISKGEFRSGPSSRVRVRTLDGASGSAIEDTLDPDGSGGRRHRERVTLVLSRQEDDATTHWTVDLVLNKDLVAPSYFEKHQHEVREDSRVINSSGAVT